MRNNVFNLHGHFWQDEPYTNDSKSIGNNPLSEFKGAQYGVGPSSHYEVIPVNGAGGARRVPGDYLYRTQESFMFDGGIWGIFRVDTVRTPGPAVGLQPQRRVQPVGGQAALDLELLSCKSCLIL